MEGREMHASASALWKWLETDAGVLARIQVMVIISASVIAFHALFGSYRRRSRSTIVKVTLWATYTLADIIVANTLGLMEFAKFRNELFLVWASFLLIVQSSAISISVYNLEDNENWFGKMLQSALLLLYATLVYNSYINNSSFQFPLAILWVLSVCKVFDRYTAFKIASTTNGQMINTKLVSDYMHYEHELSSPDEVDPASMKGFKYLILGEHERDVTVTPPDYLMRLEITDWVVTVEKIWACHGRVLDSVEAKEVCLSFALFKLLRRRFAGYPWAESRLPKSWQFVVQGLLSGDNGHERAFRVIEVELAFLYDFFYTKYAVVSRSPVIMLGSAITLIASCWISVLMVHYQPQEGDVHLGGFGIENVDVVVTFLVLFAISFVEVWQIVTYIFSDWTKVLVVCKYVEHPSLQKIDCLQNLLTFVCRKRFLKPWDNKIGQYSLLHSYDFEPSILDFRPRFMEPIRRGQKADPFIQVPEEVKVAIAEFFKARNDGLTVIGEVSLALSGASTDLAWACKLETHTHTILVWHVATTLCMITARSQAPEDLFNRVVATSLSKYCAYLVVFARKFLPERNYITVFTFDRIVRETREVLRGCRTMLSKFDKMMQVEDEPKTIVEKGAKLGKQLIEKVEDESLRWRVLRELWVEIILYIAPSDNLYAHAEHLATGGEFITHIWALLCHAGILERPPPPTAEP